MTGDHITLTGIRARGNHGVFEHERRDGQDFVVDLTVWVDFAAAAASDDLSATVNYGEIAELVVAEIESQPVDLIETLVERIAARVLIETVALRTRVTVHKPQAPISVPFTDVSVTITRSRPGAVH